MRQRGFARALRLATGLVVVAMFGLPVRSAAQEVTQMGLTAVQEAATTLVSAGDLIGALPYLVELERRLRDAAEPQRQGLEAVYFFMGLAHMQRYGTAGDEALTQAIAAFSRYLEVFPNGDRAHFARGNRADCFRVQGKFREAADDLIAALSPPLAGKGDGNFRRRSLEGLTLCLAALSAWEEGLPWFRQFFAESFDGEKKALGASALLQAYIELGRFDEGLGLLPFLVGDSPARYDVALNLALIRGGDRLQNLGRTAQAALLYYVALTTEEIRAYFTRVRDEKLAGAARLRQLQRGLDRATELEAEAAMLAAQLKALDEVPSFTADLEWRRARIYSAMDRSLEAFWAYQRLVDRFPDSPQVEDYMFAMLAEARRAGRPDDALRTGQTYLARQDWQRYRREVTVQVVELYGERGDVEQVLALGGAFVDEFPDDPLAVAMVFQLGNAYLQAQRFAELQTRFEGWLEVHRDVPMEDGLIYWSGMARLFGGEYDPAEAHFRRLTSNFADSAYYEDARFRIGVCEFGREDLEASGRTFEKFVADFPDSVLRGEAEVFLGDVSAAAARVDKALSHYGRVGDFTDQMRFIDHATFQSGRLLEANGRYAEMAEIFQNYINRYREAADISSAVFQLGRAKELLGRPEEMLEEYLAAVERFGDDPQAEGVDAILRTYATKDAEHRNALAANLALRDQLRTDAAFRERLARERTFRVSWFRENPLADEAFRNSVNRDPEYAERLVTDAGFRESLLSDYVRRNERFPTQGPIEIFRDLHLRATSQGQRTLELRLLPILERLGLPVSEGRAFGDDDLELASADTLVWIADARRATDAALAQRAYTRVVEAYPESGAVRPALMGLGELMAQAGDHEVALGYFQQAQDLFPAAPEAGWARLRQGDMLRQLGRTEEAVERYQDVVRTREWRGPVTVQAQFQIGQTYFEAEDWLKAHGYFQRVYVAFPQFEQWASLAYLRSGQALERLNRIDEARNTYREMLSNPLYERTAAAAEARQALGQP